MDDSWLPIFLRQTRAIILGTYGGVVEAQKTLRICAA